MKKLDAFGVAFLFFLVASMLLFSCGGGGDDTPPQSQSNFSGVASKGLIAGGDVAIYAIDEDGLKVSPALASGTTGSDGSYSLSIDYSGPVIVEVTSGTYIDEATGDSVVLTQPLRAAVPSVDGSVEAAVTPLTEIATRIAGASGGLLPDKIAAANDLLSQLLGANADIITTQPADPGDASAFGDASAAAQNYCLLLAAISQMAETAGQDVMDIAEAIGQDLQNLEMDQTGTQLLAALSAFLSSGHNQTGATEAEQLADILNAIVADGLEPTGSLVEAKDLLTTFLKDPSQDNYDALIAYLDAFTPSSKEAYLFKAMASLINIYQSSAAGFITGDLNLDTDFEAFDAYQFINDLLSTTTWASDISALFADIAERLDDAYDNLEQAEGVDTFISLTGFDTVYLDDIDVKILKTITKSLQTWFIYAQAVDLQVDDWMVTDGAQTVDIRDLLSSDPDISDAQQDEFLTKNPDLLSYARLAKLADFRTAISQVEADLSEVVGQLEAMGAAGRKARRHNAFNLDSDLDLYLVKAFSEQTMASLVEAMSDAAASIQVASAEEVGSSLIEADDGYTYLQTEYDIYLTPNTPAGGLITIHDLVNGAKSPRDLIDEVNTIDEWEPYLEGSPTLFQDGILDIDWDNPIE